MLTQELFAKQCHDHEMVIASLGSFSLQDVNGLNSLELFYDDTQDQPYITKRYGVFVSCHYTFNCACLMMLDDLIREYARSIYTQVRINENFDHLLGSAPLLSINDFNRYVEKFTDSPGSTNLGLLTGLMYVWQYQET